MATVDLYLTDTVPWVVPNTVTSLIITAKGASGAHGKTGDGPGSGGGGSGSKATTGSLTVAPGDVLRAVVASGGGYPNGGSGTRGFSGLGDGGDGGGSTTVYLNGAPLLICAGGGGGGGWPGGQGSSGGYPHGGGAGGGGSESGSAGAGGGGGGYKAGAGGNTGGGGSGGDSWKADGAGAVSWATGGGGGYATVTYTPPDKPNPPTVVGPVAGDLLSSALGVAFKWQHNGGAPQVSADIQWRPAGGGTVTTGTVAGTGTELDQTLAVGDWEWQVRTYGQVASDWTPWTAFTVATAPATPTIGLPANGTTITTLQTLVTWAATGQVAAQIQVVGDDGGAPDYSSVLWDSGLLPTAVGSGTANFTFNGIDVHVLVRIRDARLWSGWADVKVSVEWALPEDPVVDVRGDDSRAAIVASWTHPNGSVTVDYAEVWVVEDGAASMASSQIPAGPGSFIYWTPRSDVNVAIRVRAYAATGVYSETEAS